MIPAWHQLVPISGHVEESETARKLQLYATSIKTSVSTRLIYSEILTFLFKNAKLRNKKKKKKAEEVNFRSQILECPSIGQYWNIFGVPVLLENVSLTFFRTC